MTVVAVGFVLGLVGVCAWFGWHVWRDRPRNRKR